MVSIEIGISAYTYRQVAGIAPYNGIVAVVQNSRCVSESEHRGDPHYGEIQRQCVEVAKLLQCTAPMRIDVRRFKDEKSSSFALFDVNMKPVSCHFLEHDDIANTVPEHDGAWKTWERRSG
jgi:hypothetical protein